MVKKYFKKNVSNRTKELFKHPPKKYLKITALYINHKWQIDLMFMGKIVMLSVIDIFSRYGWCTKVANKQPKSVLTGFQYIISKFNDGRPRRTTDEGSSYSRREASKNARGELTLSEGFRNSSEGRSDILPETIQCDGGTEFMGVFNKFLINNNIEKYIVKGDVAQDKSIHYAQGIVERYNRTMRDLIKNYMEEEEKITISSKDLDILSEGYNDNKHSSIKAKPYDIYFKKEEKGEETKRVHNIKGDVKFKVGDKVRLLLQHAVMVKNRKMKKNYTKRVYLITQRDDGNKFMLNDKKLGWIPYNRLMISKDKVTVKNQKTHPPPPPREIKKIEKKETRKKNKKIMIDSFKVFDLYKKPKKGDEFIIKEDSLWYNGKILKSLRYGKFRVLLQGLSKSEEVQLKPQTYSDNWYLI